MENKKTKSVFTLISEDGKSFKAYNEAAFYARFGVLSPQAKLLREVKEVTIKQDAWVEMGIPALINKEVLK